MADTKNINQKLINEKSLEGKFEGSQERRNIYNEDYFKTCVDKIEKMDVILKLKIADEKKVKLSRIKAEEESRNILCESLTPSVSTAIKINFSEFISLLNQGDPTDFAGRKAAEENISGERDEIGQLEKCENRQRSSGASFIQKNIQLAKCGRGILSLTEKEQQRVQNLLTEIEDTSEENEWVPNMKNLYGLDDESKFILNRIDRRLEVFKKIKNLKPCSGNLFFFTKRTEEKGEANMEGDETGPIKNDGKWGGEKNIKRNRLKEINKLLNYATSVSSEEINPLSREDIQLLVDQGKESVNEYLVLTGIGNEEMTKLFTCKFSQEVIAELVSNAKTLMPKFKYRFGDT